MADPNSGPSDLPPSLLDGRAEKKLWTSAESFFSQRTAKEHASHLVPHLRSGMRVLDIGCGPGTITADLATIVSPGHVTGIDTDTRFVTQAQETALRSGKTNLEFMEGSIYDLSSFADETFDVVHAHQVILHLQRPVEGLRELRRVLKQGGILSLRDNMGLKITPNNELIDNVYQRVCDMMIKNGANPHAGLEHHIWTSKAGFTWDKIFTGAATFELSEPSQLKGWADMFKGYLHVMGSQGYGTEELRARIAKGWDEWALDQSARVLAFESTVIAVK